MALISKILRNAVDNGLLWHCPGCKCPHMIHHGAGIASVPRWTWNGDVDRPTFSPSVLVTWREPSDVESEFDDPTKDVAKTCHSYVTDGQMVFLTDCTHALAGQTVPIPDWPNPHKWEERPDENT